MRWVLILGLTLITLISVLSFSATAEDDVNHVARVNGVDYTTLSDAFAVEGDITVELLKDVELSDVITIPSGKSVTLTGAHTITRGKLSNGNWYTGTLFSVGSGATLTIDGGLTIDGDNEWTFDDENFFNDMKTGSSKHPYATLQEGAPVAANYMFNVYGHVNMNNATIQNNCSSTYLFYLQNGSSLDMNNGAKILDNYTNGYNKAVAVYVCPTAVFTMNDGSEMSGNYHPNANGSIIQAAGTIIMNGGTLCSNYGNSSGIIMLYNNNSSAPVRPNMTMNGGSICHNGIHSGGWGGVIYVHGSAKGSIFTMTGGVIEENYAYRATSIVGNGDNNLSEINLLGGTIKAPAGHMLAHPELLSYSEITIGKNMIMEGELFWNGGFEVHNDGSMTFVEIQLGGKGKDGNYVLSGDGVWEFDRLNIQGSTTVTITNGTFNGDLPDVDNSIITIEDGTFSDLSAIKYLADGNGLAKNSDGSYTVTDQVAEVNGVIYNSIEAAVAALGEEGGTIKLLCIAPVKTEILIDKPITIDLNGNDIYALEDGISVFRSTSELTIEGEGTVDAKTFAESFAYTVGDEDTAGSVTINGGDHLGSTTVAFVENGVLNITDGYFEATPYVDSEGNEQDRRFTIDCDDENFENGSATTNITGGTFYGFNPKNNISQGDNTNFVHEDYSTKNNSTENTWTVGLADFIARVESTGERYESLAEAVAAAGANGTDTVTLLKNIELCELVTLTAGNVTINADGYTITRGKLEGGEWYTGTLFSISAGATLTLDGGLIIDGAHNWTYKDTDGDGVTDLQSAVDNYTDFTGYNGLRFISRDPDAPIAQEDMFIVNGSLVFADLTIKNHYGIEGASVVQINNGGVLTMGDDTVLTHNVTPSYGTLVAMNSGSTFNMNGGIMSQNVSAHHGVCVFINGGTMTVNGGKVMHNHACGGQGTFVRLNAGQLIINGGEVYENVAFPSEGNSRNKVGAVIDCTGSGKVTINDVYIHNNFGYWVGGVNHVGSEFVINGGKFLNNTAWAEFSAGHHLQDVSFGKPNGKVTGGIFTTEIYQACVNTANSDTIIPDGREEFVLGTDSEGNPVLWGVFEGFIITFIDEDGNVLQSGPVYKGELPVFNGDITAPDGYFVSWDKKLVPATAEETYTLVFKPIVAEIVKADGTHGGYFASLQDAIDNAVSTDTVKLHRDIELTDKITVSDKEITIDGNAHTITRGKNENDTWYTGTLFSISADASLTLDGGLVIDGGNEWTYKEVDGAPYLKTVVENYSTTRVPYDQHEFVTLESGAPRGTSVMIAVNGDVTMKGVTIKNNATASSLISIGNGGSLTTNENTLITHNVGQNGAIVNMVSGSEFIMNGGTISETASHDHGGVVYMSGGTFTMNDALIENNHTTGQGSFLRLNGGTFIMNDGELRQNVALPFSAGGNKAGAVIDNTRTGVVEIHGGYIHDNYGFTTGGINHVGTSLTITGGTLVDNVAWGKSAASDKYADVHQNDIFYAVSASKPVSITGGTFGTDIYGACTGTDEQDQAVTPNGYEQFVIGTDENGNPNLWTVAAGWVITFVDENGNTLQSEPVRNGEMPVLNGAIASRDGYFWHWDADLVAATANATYQVVWELTVAEIINSDGTHGGYYSSLQSAIDAADSGDTVKILIDTVELTEQVTVSGKSVIIDGNGKTVTRGKLENGNWYTGTLFNVEAGAGLTLGGGLIIDGANAWTYTDTDGDGVTDLQEVFENYVHTSYGALKFVTLENGGAVANADMLTVSGSLTINSATIQNHYGTSGNRVIELTGGSLTVNDGALLTHNATSGSGTLVSMNSLSTFELNGGTISESVGHGDGGTINVGSGSMIMNGGIAENNHTTAGRGSLISISGGSFKMNDGTIQKNLAIGGNGSAINNMNGGTVTINGGSINNNYGSRVGGINSYNSMLYITGGQLVNNVAFMGDPSNDLAYSHNTNTTDKIHAEITGGIFTTDVYQGLVPYNEETAQAVTPGGYEQFVLSTDSEGNPVLWGVFEGFTITFIDEDGNVLQSGPVYKGELPTFNGTIPSRDGYVWSWDKTISPATEDVTYTLVWKLIVAEIIKADGTFGGYCTSLQNAIDAAQSGDTVRLLVDISITSRINILADKNFILDGNGHTITRGKDASNKWYTGTLFSISSGATITLDGNLTISGGNNWTFKEAEYNEALEGAFYAGANGLAHTLYSGYVFVQRESGSYTNVASPMFDIAGNLIINNTTIKNQIGQVMTTNGGSVVLNSGTLITNNAYDGNALGGVAHINGGTKFTINSGAEISNNYVGGNAGVFRVGGSVLTMNGGVIKGTRGVNCNGTVMMLYTGNATFIMNDGLICDNIGLPGPNNGHACAIYLHSTGIMEMYGGTICHNTGRTVGGIIANSGNSKLTIYNGAIVNNIHTSMYTTDNTPTPYGHDVQRGNGTVKILGGVFTQDVNLWCGEEYIAVPQLYREIDGYGQHTVEVFDDRDAWLVGKTSIESDLQGDDRFGELRADGESVITVIANGSSFTAEYTIKHFYSKAYDMALTFDKELPVGTAIILQHTDENGAVRYWSYVVESATDTVLLDEFKLMGSADSYYADVELMRDVTLKVVVDFGAVAENARPEGTLSFDMELAPDTSFVSGAVLRESTEDVQFVTTEVGTSTQNSPSDQKFSYSVSFSDGNGQQITDTDLFVYDDQYFALHVIIPDAPADAILTVNGNVYLPYKTGYYIIPLGNDFETDIQMTLSSDMFPATYVTYASSCQLYVSNSTVATSPLNGIAIGSTLTGEFTIDGRASVDITCEDDKKVFTEEQDITVTVKSNISALYELAVVIEQKDENGNYVALNIAYAVSGDQYTFDLAGLEFGSYRIVATVKDSASGALITQEFYYFLIG